ncbi:MAG: hypothetical protein HYU37_06160 [Acidobacteria bacterium]|nr:hypothetical protein [Acidobacteriota bacterium]
MPRRLAGPAAVAGVTLVAALATATLVGQTRSTSNDVPARTADGQPDLEGVWRATELAGYDLEPHSASYGVPAGMGVVVDPADGLIPYKPWALARKKENFAKSRIRFPYDPLQNPDPVARCYIPGVPRITYLGWPFEIVQSKEFVAFVYEWMHIRRMVPLTGRPVPQGVPLWGGVSRGRWEGNTLVVRVTNLSDWTWLDMAGNFHSKAAQVEERYTPAGPDTLDYEVIITDPDVYTRPWTIRMPIQRQRNARLLEYECHELLEEAGVPLTWERDWDKPLQVPKE